MGEQARRLDSWKEIAEYLGRDVRTAMRWAKTQGLPVRRVAGGRGRSVFAFADEIDAWLAGQPGSEPPAAHETASAPVDGHGPAPSRRRMTSRSAVFAAAATLALIAAGATLALRAARRTSEMPVQVSAAADAIRMLDRAGAEHVVHRFDAAVQTVFSRPPAEITDFDADGRVEVTVGVAYYDEPGRRSVRSGELMNLTPRGDLRWKFAFDDTVTFREVAFNGPWALTDWQVSPAGAPARIAVAGHDSVWWASIATVIDHRGRRLSTFVNPGWIESLLWLDQRRLAVAGFNNARDAAVIAVIDTAREHGQAPGSTGTPFECLSCPSDPPVFYATLPRSELNRLTASRFNRAQVSRLGDRIVVMAIEVPGDPLAAAAIYEFGPDLRLRRARYDDAYWDTHRRLELEGRLGHSRATCPERDGPPAIHVWSDAGWQRIAAPR